MTTYAYVALEPSGKKKSGYLDAASKEAAMAAITAEGRYVLEIKEQTTQASAKEQGEGKRRGAVSKSDIALFTRRMADMADAGLPLDRVLRVVAEQSESGVLTEVAEAALKEVQGGKSVSDALSAYPKLFPQIYTQTLKSGEASGQFPQVATRLAEFQEKDVQRRSQIVSALVYPVILAFTAVFVIVFLLTFVVPRLSSVFASLGDELPASTKLLLLVTSFLTTNYLLIIGGIVAIIFAYKAWVSTESGALLRDTWLLRAPVLGPVIRKATVSRFSRVLGTLLFGGVPILQAIDMAGLATGNRLFMQSARKVEDEVREGRNIHEAMRDTGAFPPVLTHMVAIGEETGDLPKMLNRVSDSMDFEVDNGMRRLTSLAEPIIVLVMGTFVGFVVLSVMLPIVQAQETIK
ncbi:MAG: type II secretion system F family protein [Fimbriimonas sp.]